MPDSGAAAMTARNSSQSLRNQEQNSKCPNRDLYRGCRVLGTSFCPLTLCHLLWPPDMDCISRLPCIFTASVSANERHQQGRGRKRQVSLGSLFLAPSLTGPYEVRLLGNPLCSSTLRKFYCFTVPPFAALGLGGNAPLCL